MEWKRKDLKISRYDMVRSYGKPYGWKVGYLSGARITNLPELLDEFTAHPNYMIYVRLTYAELMAEISDSTLIEDILSKLYGKPVTIKKMATSISKEILESNYAIS